MLIVAVVLERYKEGGDVKMNAHAKVGSKAFSEVRASLDDREWRVQRSEINRPFNGVIV